MTLGRPLMFENAEQLQKKIDAYFAGCHDEDGKLLKPYTITGLALALGTYRQTLLNYEERPDFVDTIKTAKQRCENFAEEQLFMGKSPTGPIFALKNYDWRDTQDMNLGGQQNNPVKASIDINFVKTNE